MPRPTTPVEATIIDYLYRNGGEGSRQALIDGMELTTDYATATVKNALYDMARDGLIERDGDWYEVADDPTEGWY